MHRIETLPPRFLPRLFVLPQEQLAASAVYADPPRTGYSTSFLEVVYDSAYSGFRYRLHLGKITGSTQGWSDGGLVSSRMGGPVLNDKMLDEGMDYSVSLVNGCLITWRQG